VRPFSFVGSGRVGSGRVGAGRVGASGVSGLMLSGLMVAYGGRYGRGAGNRSMGAGNGPLDGFFSGHAPDRQNSQDRAHGPEKCLGFDCCPDATPGGKVTAAREK
jgi:hypothetical protein